MKQGRFFAFLVPPLYFILHTSYFLFDTNRRNYYTITRNLRNGEEINRKVCVFAILFLPKEGEQLGYETALKCFAENLQLFGDAQSAPEKYNLYNGLTNLASGIRGDMAEVKDEIRRLQDLLQQVIEILRKTK